MTLNNGSSGHQVPITMIPTLDLQEGDYGFLSVPCSSVYHLGLEDALKGVPQQASMGTEYQDGYFSLWGGNEVTSIPIYTMAEAWT